MSLPTLFFKYARLRAQGELLEFLHTLFPRIRLVGVGLSLLLIATAMLILMFLFLAIALFLFLANQTPWTISALWTALGLGIVGILSFLLGLSRLRMR